MLCPVIGPFFQGSVLALSFSGTLLVSMCNVYVALHAVSVMLHRMAFHLTGMVVALTPDNSTTKAYLCDEGGKISLFRCFKTNLLHIESL